MKQWQPRWHAADRSNKGQLLKVLLPAELPGAQQEDEAGGGEGEGGLILAFSFPMLAPTPPSAVHTASQSAMYACFSAPI